MKIGIIVAMEKEQAQLKTLFDDSHEEQIGAKIFTLGHIGQDEIVMQQCGIGKVNSAIGTVEMINNYHPELIVSSGVAGGADVSLNPTDVVVSTGCTYHDAYCGAECELGQIIGLPAIYESPTDLVEKALSINCGTKIYSGLIVSGEWFVDHREKMQQILNNFPKAMAVDMESCSIAQTCYLYNTPFISFRIISDVPLKDEKAAQYFDFWSRMAEGSFQVTKAFSEKVSTAFSNEGRHERQ